MTDGHSLRICLAFFWAKRVTLEEAGTSDLKPGMQSVRLRSPNWVSLALPYWKGI